MGTATRAGAAAAEPAVSLAGDRVTVGRSHARSRSRSTGGRASTRLQLDVRDLVVRDRKGNALLTVRRASLTPTRRVKMRVVATAPDGGRVVRDVTTKSGANVLDGRSYDDPVVRAAVALVARELRPDAATGGSLDHLQLRIGRARVSNRTGHSSGSLDALVIRVGAAASGTQARAAFPGFVEAAIGQVQSASRAVGKGLTRIAKTGTPTAVAVATGAGDVAVAAKRFLIPAIVLRVPEDLVLVAQ